MKELFFRIVNVSLFAGAVLFLGTLETSLWYQIFGYFPGPALWIPVLVYIALFRSTIEMIVLSYLTGFILSTMTAMPEGLLMSACLALALSTRLLKQRIYWSGSSYFMIVCGIGSLLFHIFHMLGTFVVEESPLMSPQIVDWIVEALLTPLAAPLLFPIFVWFDKITNRESSTEISAQVT